MKRKVIREGETEEVEEVDKDEVKGEMKEGGEAVVCPKRVGVVLVEER